MSVDNFIALVAEVTGAIAGKAVDKQLEAELNARFPANGEVFKAIAAACRQGVAEGWMCNREHGGIKFGRVAKPGPALHGFSIDVVDMADVVGPHHQHPQGEVDMIMPLDAGARFDGAPEGWLVYGPGSAHRPTVKGGQALVLYLLPGGEITFTGQ
ncbi:4-hydroxylaminobenzoate lyase [Denitromonas iodatirespirans]|uniref:DUF4863 family protein n=1 Tax=Denitromonas iodatirespirans TaxID=2795389 RepID=A0A944HA18_DENI1|nr:DUF4863 family protein [Denitromonas iodatirespirans]MBT0963819.1 DUF4863 family protein [Denitromonas iodatirespirans]